MRKIDSYRPLTPSRSGSGRATPSTYDSTDDDAWRRGDYVREASMARTSSVDDRDAEVCKKNERKSSAAPFDNHDVQKKWKVRQNADFKSLTELPLKPSKQWPPKEWPNVEIWRKDCPRCGGMRHTAIAQQCTRLCRLCGTFQHIRERCPRNKDVPHRKSKSTGNGNLDRGLEKKRDKLPAQTAGTQDKAVVKPASIEKRRDAKVVKPALVENKHEENKVVKPTLVEKKHDENKVIRPTLVENRHDDGNNGKSMGLEEPWRGFSLKLAAADQTMPAKPTLSNATRNNGMYRDSVDHGGRSSAGRAESVSERRSSGRWDARPQVDWDQSNRTSPVEFGRDRHQAGRLTPVDFGNNVRRQTDRLMTPVDFGNDDRGRFNRTPPMNHRDRSWEPPQRWNMDRDTTDRQGDENLRTENEQLRSNCDSFRTRSEKLFSQNLTLLRDRELLRRQLEMLGAEKRQQPTSTPTATNSFDPSFWLRQMQMMELEKMRSAGLDATALQQQLEMAELEKRRADKMDLSPQLRQADVVNVEKRLSGSFERPLALRQQQDMAEQSENRPQNGFEMPFPMMPMAYPGMPFGAFPPQYYPLQMDRSWLSGYRYPM